jgi:methyl-accepting chemotaxis protein
MKGCLVAAGSREFGRQSSIKPLSLRQGLLLYSIVLTLVGSVSALGAHFLVRQLPRLQEQQKMFSDNAVLAIKRHFLNYQSGQFEYELDRESLTQLLLKLSSPDLAIVVSFGNGRLVMPALSGDQPAAHCLTLFARNVARDNCHIETTAVRDRGVFIHTVSTPPTLGSRQIIVTLLAVLVSIVISSLFIGRSLRPIARFKQYVLTMDADRSNFSDQAYADTNQLPIELLGIANSFNRMLDKLVMLTVMVPGLSRSQAVSHSLLSQQSTPLTSSEQLTPQPSLSIAAHAAEPALPALPAQRRVSPSNPDASDVDLRVIVPNASPSDSQAA